MELITERLRQRILSQDRNSIPALPYHLALKAWDILQSEWAFQTEDILRFLCAANYLNAFVKQSQNPLYHHEYRFKSLLTDYLLTLNDSTELTIFSEENVLMVECEGLIFSFHGMDLNRLKPCLKQHSPSWAHIRLQPYAIELLTEAIKNHS